jgi:hypothetical protein
MIKVQCAAAGSTTLPHIVLVFYNDFFKFSKAILDKMHTDFDCAISPNRAASQYSSASSSTHLSSPNLLLFRVMS